MDPLFARGPRKVTGVFSYQNSGEPDQWDPSSSAQGQFVVVAHSLDLDLIKPPLAPADMDASVTGYALPVTAATSLSLVSSRSAAHASLRLCVSASLRLCVSAALRLCDSAALRLCVAAWLWLMALACVHPVPELS